MLASGSLYVFALYAPSFTGRLGYSQTQTSTIAVIGDIGLYGVGPLSGLMADRLGARPTSFIAGVLLLMGYGLLSAGYATGLENVAKGEAPTHFLWMGGFLFMAGMGSSASYMAAFTSLAKNFRNARGAALGIPVSFFGLSAAILTFIAQAFFMMNVSDFVNNISSNNKPTTPKNPQEGAEELDTVGFLLFLGVAGGVINGLSVFGMNILAPPTITTDPESNTTIAPVQAQGQGPLSEQTPLLRENTTTDTLASRQGDYTLGTQAATTTVPSVSDPPLKPRDGRRYVRSISGKEFFMDGDAQAFFVIMVCLAGTGLMIINSISAMVDAVAGAEQGSGPRIPLLGAEFRGDGSGEDGKTPMASIRATHVVLISLSSYAGRIMSGLGSDLAIVTHGAHRVYAVPIAAICMGLAQVAGLFANLHWLYLTSALTGLAYGGFFGVAGTVVAELWGEETCGQNWGWLSWGSAIGGMLFNLLFGLIMDAERPVADEGPQACYGRHCYRWALIASLGACVLSCVLSIRMALRQRALDQYYR
ncbi:hypothetical protein EC957_009533 [Mortierella hygrophila]|uniref:Nodulin-like domain-containing protein n=1 Tax=Mortierella hygrophila TaxID=979708 RepID=A0A9P6FB06_9FUNG|nr:hypothetical protein EC957_009533 [Mortierella hygrophila]